MLTKLASDTMPPMTLLQFDDWKVKNESLSFTVIELSDEEVTEYLRLMHDLPDNESQKNRAWWRALDATVVPFVLQLQAKYGGQAELQDAIVDLKIEGSSDKVRCFLLQRA